MAAREESRARQAPWPKLARKSRLGFGLLAALLLTTLTLAYLGVNSVRSEALAARKILEETHRGIAAIVGERIDAFIEDSDRDLFRELAASHTDLRDFVEHLHRVSTQQTQQPYALLLLSHDGRLLYPPRGTKLPAPTVDDAAEPSTSEFDRLLSAAEDAELREGRPGHAATLYGEALGEAVADEDRALALNGKARCELKANRPEKALETYNELIAMASTLEPDPARRVLVAHYQAIVCYDRMADEAGAARAAVDLFKALLGMRFIVEEDFYLFYRGELEGVLRKHAMENTLEPEIEELRRLEEQQLEIAAALESSTRLAARFAPTFLEQPTEKNIPRYFATRNAEEGVIAIAIIEAAAGEASGDLGGVGRKDTGELLLVHHWSKAEVVNLTRKALSQGGAWTEAGLALLGPDGLPVFTSTAEVPRDLAPSGAALTNLPGWRVSAFPLGGSFEATAARAVRRYTLFLVLVLGTVVASLVLAGRSVSKEVALSRLRSEFVASVSHELKTPLAVIRMFAQNLRAGWVNEPKRTEYYEVITRESERLTDLINNVLNMSRIESGTQQYEMVTADLRELLRGTLARYRPHLTAAEIELSELLPEGPVTAQIDPEAIDQLLINLLSNATKYIGEGERKVEVSLSVETDQAVLRVADTGIGMSPEQISHIFDRFYRAPDASRRSVAGSGIGLTLVRHIVDGHGGEIHVESAPGKGSTFAIVLPMSRPEAAG